MVPSGSLTGKTQTLLMTDFYLYWEYLIYITTDLVVLLVNITVICFKHTSENGDVYSWLHEKRGV